MQKRKWIPLVLLRKLLTAAICSIAFMGLFSVHVHVVPSSKDQKFNDKIPTVRTLFYFRVLFSIWGLFDFPQDFVLLVCTFCIEHIWGSENGKASDIFFSEVFCWTKEDCH